MPQVEILPRPYLTREEVNERLRTLGFILGPKSLDYPAGHQKAQFVALQELMAGAIADWVDLRDDIRDEEEGRVEQELAEWTEEYLVG